MQPSRLHHLLRERDNRGLVLIGRSCRDGFLETVSCCDEGTSSDWQAWSYRKSWRRTWMKGRQPEPDLHPPPAEFKVDPQQQSGQDRRPDARLRGLFSLAQKQPFRGWTDEAGDDGGRASDLASEHQQGHFCQRCGGQRSSPANAGVGLLRDPNAKNTSCSSDSNSLHLWRMKGNLGLFHQRKRKNPQTHQSCC